MTRPDANTGNLIGADATDAEYPEDGLMPRFKRLGAIAAHMTIIANYPIHVNGAYRDKRNPTLEFVDE